MYLVISLESFYACRTFKLLSFDKLLNTAENMLSQWNITSTIEANGHTTPLYITLYRTIFFVDICVELLVVKKNKIKLTFPGGWYTRQFQWDQPEFVISSHIINFIQITPIFNSISIFSIFLFFSFCYDRFWLFFWQINYRICRW